MASLRVKPVRNLGEIRNCGLGYGPSRKKGFVNYADNGLGGRRAPRLILCGAAGVVSRNVRSDRDSATSGSSGSSFSSVLDHNCSQLWPLATSITGDHRRRKDDVKEEDFSGKFDKWIKESVVEILNNLEEAPFLVHIYSDGEEGSASPSKTRLVKEKATSESWPLIKGRFGGGNPTPTGIILVEEMENSEAAAISPDGDNLGSRVSESCSSTRAWGILIQGRGLSFPACYIMKTCRVKSVLGCCTHFCLARTECFFETVDTQLKKLWLV